jgi:hypothetical protein
MLLGDIARMLWPYGRWVMSAPWSARRHHAAWNKLIVLSVRLARPRLLLQAVWTWPLLLPVGPIALVFLAGFHASAALGFGSREDSLGYLLTAERGAPAAVRA